MKHVCVVTSAHPWDDVRVGSRIVSSLVDAGYRVTWVGPDRTLSAEQDVRLPGVEYRLFNTGPTRVDRLRGASRAFALARQVSEVDWWYSPDPDMAGKLPKLVGSKGGKTLFDIHESYHRGVLERWFPVKPPAIARELLRHRITQTCERMDLVMGVSDRVLEPYCERQPSVIVVRNLAPASFASDRDHVERSSVRMKMIHGKLSLGNGTSQVAQATALLDPELQAKVSVLMLDVAATAASARAEVAGIAATLQDGTLCVGPGVPHEQMADLMASCSVGLIAYQRDLGYESLPNRLFEYMAAGLTILAPSYSPEIVKILEEEQIGLTADFEVPGEIARVIQWCVTHPAEVAEMGARARSAYLERYTWDTEAAGLVQAMQALEG